MLPRAVNSVRFSPDGSMLACGLIKPVVTEKSSDHLMTHQTSASKNKHKQAQQTGPSQCVYTCTRALTHSRTHSPTQRASVAASAVVVVIAVVVVVIAVVVVVVAVVVFVVRVVHVGVAGVVVPPCDA